MAILTSAAIAGSLSGDLAIQISLQVFLEHNCTSWNVYCQATAHFYLSKILC